MARKYTKSRKQTKKRNQFNKKNNNLKRTYKTRKMRGGTYENDNGYELAGFLTNTYLNPEHAQLYKLNELPKLPIFLHKEKTPRNMLPGTLYQIHVDGFSRKYFLLPVIYKLNYRGLDFKNEFKHNNYFVDDNDKGMVNDYRNWEHSGMPNFLTEMEGPFWNENKNNVREIELKYPGLFQRIFVTEKEEQQALEELQRKERKLQQRPNETSYDEEIQNNKLEEEKMHKISPEEMEFMEFTNRITPFLRDDLKKNRKNKISRKRIPDTNVTIGNPLSS